MVRIRSIASVASVAVTAAALFAGGAYAGDSSPRQQQYENPTPAAVGGTLKHTAGAPAAATTSSGSLPFTGLQLGGAVGLSVVLLVAGFGVRRLGASRKG